MGTEIEKLSTIDRNRRLRDSLELRKAGAAYADIAQRLGWGSAAAAQRAVKKALSKQIGDESVEAKMIMIEQLTHLQMIAWAKASKGDMAAMDRCLALIDRLAKLRGLDAPEEANVHHRHEGVLVIDGETEEEYVRALQAMIPGSGEVDNTLHERRKRKKVV